MPTEAISEFAPAKVNLALHVTGQQADGYHLLDSLVVFVDVGDVVSLQRSDRLGLHLTGPQAGSLSAGDDNLVLRAARLMGVPVALTLDKRLPVASGLGGGSADAAAALRGIARLYGLPLPSPDTVLGLGADVPVCLAGRPVRMCGIGETLVPLDGLPHAWLVLVNPGVAVSTPEVFRQLRHRDNPPMPTVLPRFGALDDLVQFLKEQRNDLQPSAERQAAVITEVVAILGGAAGCRFVRMSGSGATCFGLFAGQAEAETAAAGLRKQRPDWWVAAGAMLDQK
jgi:4-diphosphocytidyl-2-C-methyl-D-erythritol kinase